MRRIASLLVLVGLAAGCGGGGASGGTTAPMQGRALFARACAGCHTLQGRESGSPGGDLAIPRMSVSSLESFARVMPVRPPLSQLELAAVADYIHAEAARRRRG